MPTSSSPEAWSPCSRSSRSASRTSVLPWRRQRSTRSPTTRCSCSSWKIISRRTAIPCPRRPQLRLGGSRTQLQRRATWRSPRRPRPTTRRSSPILSRSATPSPRSSRRTRCSVLRRSRPLRRPWESSPAGQWRATLRPTCRRSSSRDTRLQRSLSSAAPLLGRATTRGAELLPTCRGALLGSGAGTCPLWPRTLPRIPSAR
mmetsp:Transcript_46995/g.100569  ORF Transcript_46995/g.100569 Transcript_46995/m.100569 type:complete len:202 (+) Transcript_46995:731-1336(+)